MPNGVLTQEMVQAAADAAVLRGHQQLEPMGLGAQVGILTERESALENRLTNLLQQLEADGSIQQAVQDAVVFGTGSVEIPTRSQHNDVNDSSRYATVSYNMPLDGVYSVPTLSRPPTAASVDEDVTMVINNYREKLEDLREQLRELRASKSKVENKLEEASADLKAAKDTIKELKQELDIFHNYYFEKSHA